jgi:hypothetical protein
MESRRLSIPIYLNQRIVFDLLAIVEGGFSQLQTIKTAEAGEKSTKADAAAEVGAKNVFAFLNLGFKGSVGKLDSTSTQKQIEEQRVFTPASLFSRLRDNLLDRKLLVLVDDPSLVDDLQSGVFVEFSGILRKNPLIASMEGLIQVMEAATLFLKEPGKPKPKAEEAVLAQMRKFLQIMTQSGSLDLVAELISKPDFKAVIPVQQEYFSNERPADIIDGQFVVLGKVARHVKSNSDEAINLLRGTPMAYLPEENLNQALQVFSTLPSTLKPSGGILSQIPGPALLVIPIAIYA